ncbi:MAG: ABC transporter ATP-binding protein [Burkholderiales bacterium]|nr:ABC transporter ATP-binding protein [Burkholderiales bacterium]
MIEGELERTASALAEEKPLAISVQGLGKAYRTHASPLDRLKEALLRRPPTGDPFWALRDVSFEVQRGEALGVIGRNGAGKSTLLQLLCGTLAPTEGSAQVHGRIAALLELGAGFNPNFTGRDNVLLNGPLLGLTREQLQERMEAIIAFSGIGDFIDQPVKTYSSGMFVRLAFSLATSVEPDVLVVDEALSVGDGEFARKSFDRILAMKERGVTILFCSHVLYQVEAFCNRVIWLHGGRLQAIGEPHVVMRQYDLYLADQVQQPAAAEESRELLTTTPGHARIRKVHVGADGQLGQRLTIRPGESTLRIDIEFDSDPSLPPPLAGVTIDLPGGMALTCAVARADVDVQRDARGSGSVTVEFPRLALRKGHYTVGAYLGHETGIHIYDTALAVATLYVDDRLPEPGYVTLPHRWTSRGGPGR